MTKPWVGFLLVLVASMAGASPEDKFIETMQRIAREMNSQMEKAKAVYRKEFAEQLRSAGRIEVYIVDADSIIREPNGEFDGFVSQPAKTKNPIRIAPYRAVAEILQTKVIEAEPDRQSILGALADQIGAQDQSGGAFGHFPQHGIRVFAADNRSKVVLESTFCWRCCNFGFTYPQGETAWLSTSTALESVFARLLPIPKVDTAGEHGNNTDSADGSTVEHSGADQPATKLDGKPPAKDQPSNPHIE